MIIQIKAPKILDFDIENRPLSYLGHDFTTSEITAIAASFGPYQTMHCWLLGDVDMLTMLKGFRELYDQADMVTGHYIRKHDLPIINGAMLENGLPALGPKLSCDTCLDLITVKGVSKSQESLGGMLGLAQPKVGMSQAMWREANRLTPEGLAHTERRVTGDVRQHQAMRAKLAELDMLKRPKVWDGRAGR
jgi:hypothetical protein